MTTDRSAATGRSAEDTLAIVDTVVRYGFVLDDRDWGAFDLVFTVDAVFDFRDLERDPPRGPAPLVGRDEIVRQFRDIYSHPLQHMLVSHLVDDISDDEVVVRSKGIFPTPGFQFFEGEYRDVVVRTPQGWRIKHKTFKRFDKTVSPWMREVAEEARQKRASDD